MNIENIENIKNSFMNKMNLFATGFIVYKKSISNFYHNSIFMKNLSSISIQYYPYGKLFINSIIHVIFMLFIVSCMIIHKVTHLLFVRWTKFMDFVGRKRVILDRESDEPYIERYYLFLIDRNKNFPFNVFPSSYFKIR